MTTRQAGQQESREIEIAVAIGTLQEGMKHMNEGFRDMKDELRTGFKDVLGSQAEMRKDINNTETAVKVLAERADKRDEDDKQFRAEVDQRFRELKPPKVHWILKTSAAVSVVGGVIALLVVYLT